jgi:hypothetical protein
MTVSERRELERQAREAFIEDYHHFKGYGWSSQQIAERLGLRLTTLQEKVRKLGLEVVRSSEEKYFLAELDRWIDSGKPFSTNNLPNVLDETQIKPIMSTVKARGRIRAIGRAKIAGSTATATLWIGAHVELEESDAA